jgi:CRISPR/Cas system-associated endonuclease Cas1
VVLRCLSAGIVRFEEFETAPDAGCPVNARARQGFLAAYERRMLTVFNHEPTGRRVSCQVGLGLQTRALARAILNPDQARRPVRWK